MAIHDSPLDIEDQINLMKKYVVFSKKVKMRRFIKYTGYFRASRYGKYLLSHTHTLGTKPTQDLLFTIYDFDVELRELLFLYCKKAEVQFKSNLSNAVSLKASDATFYLNNTYYTPSRSEKGKTKRNSNIKFYTKFFKNVVDDEKTLRKNVNRYPELKEYRTGGKRYTHKIPSWAAFSYFEFGTIGCIYAYLRGDLRKEVLVYGYSRGRYGKEVTKQMDTWIDAIRNLRNVCAHHNKLVGRTSSVVLLDSIDDSTILINDTDLFSRLYALKKVLRVEDSNSLKIELRKLIIKCKFNIFSFNILPSNWENLYNRINYL